VVSFSLAYKAKDAKAGSKIVAINGKEIYNEKCTLCHGDNGKLGMAGAKDLSVTQLPHAGIVEIISKGKNTMASYKGVLSPEQIEAVASYIETDLKGK
jgi:cytochrome c6